LRVQKDFVRMTVRPDDEGSQKQVKVAVLKNFFEGTESELAPLVTDVPPKKRAAVKNSWVNSIR
jgi:hypothetical protein